MVHMDALAGLDELGRDGGRPHVMLLIRSLWARTSPLSAFSANSAARRDTHNDYVALTNSDADARLGGRDTVPRIGVRASLDAGERQTDTVITLREIGRGKPTSSSARYTRLRENDDSDEEDSDDLPRNSKNTMPDMAERRQDFEFHGDAPEAFEGQHSYATFVHRHHYPERFDGESIASGSRNSQMEYDDQYVYEVKGDVEKAISFGELK